MPFLMGSLMGFPWFRLTDISMSESSCSIFSLEESRKYARLLSRAILSGDVEGSYIFNLLIRR